MLLYQHFGLAARGPSVVEVPPLRAAGGHHGGWQARHRQGPGIDRYPVSALPPQTLKEARESVEREMVQDALRRHQGKISAAALELGISRPTHYETDGKIGDWQGSVMGVP